MVIMDIPWSEDTMHIAPGGALVLMPQKLKEERHSILMAVVIGGDA